MKRKVLISVLSVALVLTLCIGLFVACNPKGDETPTDTQYTVTYSLGEYNGDGDAPDSVTVDSGKTTKLPQVGVEWEDHTFLGWKADGGETLQPGTDVTVTADITYVAQWEEDQQPPTLTLSDYVGTWLNDEAGYGELVIKDEEGEVTLTYNTSATLTMTESDKAEGGYTFEWRHRFADLSPEDHPERVTYHIWIAAGDKATLHVCVDGQEANALEYKKLPETIEVQFYDSDKTTLLGSVEAVDPTNYGEYEYYVYDNSILTMLNEKLPLNPGESYLCYYLNGDEQGDQCYSLGEGASFVDPDHDGVAKIFVTIEKPVAATSLDSSYNGTFSGTDYQNTWNSYTVAIDASAGTLKLTVAGEEHSYSISEKNIYVMISYEDVVDYYYVFIGEDEYHISLDVYGDGDLSLEQDMLHIFLYDGGTPHGDWSLSDLLGTYLADDETADISKVVIGEENIVITESGKDTTITENDIYYVELNFVENFYFKYNEKIYNIFKKNGRFPAIVLLRKSQDEQEQLSQNFTMEGTGVDTPATELPDGYNFTFSGFDVNNWVEYILKFDATNGTITLTIGDEANEFSIAENNIYQKDDSGDTIYYVLIGETGDEYEYDFMIDTDEDEGVPYVAMIVCDADGLELFVFEDGATGEDWTQTDVIGEYTPTDPDYAPFSKIVITEDGITVTHRIFGDDPVSMDDIRYIDPFGDGSYTLFFCWKGNTYQVQFDDPDNISAISLVKYDPEAWIPDEYEYAKDGAEPGPGPSDEGNIHENYIGEYTGTVKERGNSGDPGQEWHVVIAAGNSVTITIAGKPATAEFVSFDSNNGIKMTVNGEEWLLYDQNNAGAPEGPVQELFVGMSDWSYYGTLTRDTGGGTQAQIEYTGEVTITKNGHNLKVTKIVTEKFGGPEHTPPKTMVITVSLDDAEAVEWTLDEGTGDGQFKHYPYAEKSFPDADKAKCAYLAKKTVDGTAYYMIVATKDDEGKALYIYNFDTDKYLGYLAVAGYVVEEYEPTPLEGDYVLDGGDHPHKLSFTSESAGEENKWNFTFYFNGSSQYKGTYVQTKADTYVATDSDDDVFTIVVEDSGDLTVTCPQGAGGYNGTYKKQAAPAPQKEQLTGTYKSAVGNVTIVFSTDWHVNINGTECTYKWDGNNYVATDDEGNNYTMTPSEDGDGSFNLAADVDSFNLDGLYTKQEEKPALPTQEQFAGEYDSGNMILTFDAQGGVRYENYSSMADENGSYTFQANDDGTATIVVSGLDTDSMNDEYTWDPQAQTLTRKSGSKVFEAAAA